MTDDRIKRWREERTADAADADVVLARDMAAWPDLSPPHAALAVLAAAFATPELNSGPAMLELVLTGLGEAPLAGAAERRAIIDALTRGLERGTIERGLSPTTGEHHAKHLRSTLWLVNQDLRAGQDVFAAGYMPGDLHDVTMRLVDSLERRQQREDEKSLREARRQAAIARVAAPVAVRPEDENVLAHLRGCLAAIDDAHDREAAGTLHQRLSEIAALLRYQVATIGAESRLALLWMLASPTVRIVLLLLLYEWRGVHSILNMDVPTFAMVGVTSFAMFRQIVMASSAIFQSHHPLFNLRAFSPTLVGVVQGLITLVSFIFMFSILIVGGCAVGFFTWPDNWFNFAACELGFAVAGLALGVIFGAIAMKWRFFLRTATVIERFLEVFSAVFFVSEQLPENLRGWFLWSPLAHGLQLTRSAYFSGYKSQDASIEYFIVSILALVVIAGVSQRVVRSQCQPS